MRSNENVKGTEKGTMPYLWAIYYADKSGCLRRHGHGDVCDGSWRFPIKGTAKKVVVVVY